MKPEEIKAALNKPVKFRSELAGVEAEFILTGAIFRKNEKGFFYQAELTSENHVLIAKLDEIEAKKEQDNEDG